VQVEKPKTDGGGVRIASPTLFPIRQNRFSGMDPMPGKFTLAAPDTPPNNATEIARAKRFYVAASLLATADTLAGSGIDMTASLRSVTCLQV
jgi:hypothetical protein